MKQVKVIDGLCGSGKTIGIAGLIKQSELKYKFIFISPYLKECHRLAGTIPDERDESLPPKKDLNGEIIYDTGNMIADLRRKFKHPINELKKIKKIPKKTDDLLEEKKDDDFTSRSGKIYSFNKLVKAGENIVATHSLFKLLDKQSLKLIAKQNYHLIVDEAVELIIPYPVHPKNFKFYCQSSINLLKITDDGILHWNKKSALSDIPLFSKDKRHMLINRIIKVDENKFMWELPIKVLEAFKSVAFFTYLYKGTILHYYLKMHGIKPYMSQLENNQRNDLPLYTDFSKLITICNVEKLNKIGNKSGSLSATWYKNSKNNVETEIEETNNFKQLAKNLRSYFGTHLQSKSNSNLWTCFAAYNKRVAPKGNQLSFVSCNLKAMNEFKERKNLGYLVNIFMNPNLKFYLQKKGLEVDESYYALSELIQWIFRSAIREGKKINIYIPSIRMRKLLEIWIAYEKIKFILKNDSKYNGIELSSLNLENANLSGNCLLKFYTEAVNEDKKALLSKLLDQFTYFEFEITTNKSEIEIVKKINIDISDK